MKPEEGEPGSVPMIRPPRLHLGREGTASRLELFFDLAYVLVIMQLAIAFVDDLSWAGLAQLTGLFVAIWFSWVAFTLYANRFDTDDLIFRLAKLLATGAIAGCAASAADAVGSKAVPFALCYLASRLIVFAPLPPGLAPCAGRPPDHQCLPDHDRGQQRALGRLGRHPR